MNSEQINIKEISYVDNVDIDNLSEVELKILEGINDSELKRLEELINGKNDDKSSFYQSRSETMAYQSKIRFRLSSITPKKNVASYNTQSILTSGSVTKKDSKLLIEIPEGYFQANEKK